MSKLGSQSTQAQYFTLPRLFHMESMEWRVESMKCQMDSMEFQMDSMEFPGGFHTIFRWIPWNGRWIPYLFHMNSIPFPGWSPYGIHVISSWINSFTLIPYNFQSRFHMESIWNKLNYI
jgi:hypothetical protein